MSLQPMREFDAYNSSQWPQLCSLLLFDLYHIMNDALATFTWEKQKKDDLKLKIREIKEKEASQVKTLK